MKPGAGERASLKSSLVAALVAVGLEGGVGVGGGRVGGGGGDGVDGRGGGDVGGLGAVGDVPGDVLLEHGGALGDVATEGAGAAVEVDGGREGGPVAVVPKVAGLRQRE